jgi:branched-chain amino acid transport system substrate-binding protein
VALFGQEQIIGARLAEKYFNDNGGVNGAPVKVILEDTAGDEAGANNAFNTLINQHKVVAIVGPTLSQQAFSADPIADHAKVPVIGPSNTAGGIPQIGEYIARVSAPVTSVAPNALKAALKIDPDIKKVAFFYAQNDAFSKSETNVFQETAKTMGLESVTVQTHQTTDKDFQTQATAALNAKPDLVVISALANDGGNLVKQLRELGYDGVIVGGNGFNTANIFPVCKAQCEDIVVAQAYSPAEANPMNVAFRDAYKAEQKKDPPQFSAQSFAAVQVVIEALRSLDKKTPIKGMALEQLRVELNKEILAGKYVTPLGPIGFDPEGEIQQTQFYVAQIKMNPDGETGRFEFTK